MYSSSFQVAADGILRDKSKKVAITYMYLAVLNEVDDSMNTSVRPTPFP